MQVLYLFTGVKKELNQKAKLSIIAYGHQLWGVTERMRFSGRVFWAQSQKYGEDLGLTGRAWSRTAAPLH